MICNAPPCSVRDEPSDRGKRHTRAQGQAYVVVMPATFTINSSPLRYYMGFWYKVRQYYYLIVQGMVGIVSWVVLRILVVIV